MMEWLLLIWVYAWRYFTGLHMDGKPRKTGRGSVMPRYNNYFWNRYSRKKRAAYRHLIFWGLVGISYGLIAARSVTTFAVSAFLPFAVSWVLWKILITFTTVTSYTDSDGVTEKYRVLRPKYARLIRRAKPPKFRLRLPDGGPVDPTSERAILADNAESHGEPIIHLRQMELMAEDVKVPKGSSERARNMRRKNTKKQAS